LAGKDEIPIQTLSKGTEDGLFEARHIIVRSHLNSRLFAQLGYPPEKMVLMPHAPLWTLADGQVKPAPLLIADQPKPKHAGLELLFIGESLWHKGLVHLYRAFKSLPVLEKRLHITNVKLYRSATDGLSGFPAPWQSYIAE
jgi:hypothetical protein